VSRPDWAKWLPAEAVAAIDKHWKQLWDQLRLLPERQVRAGELELEAVDEPQPGEAWRERFDAMWPAYQSWYLAEGDAARPSYAACRRALEQHMPELVPIYERLVELAGGGDLAARLLSLYRPPGFIVGCSQGAWTRGEPLLVRNYDYPADRLEGVVSLSKWGERRVIGMSDCLWGLLDGMNDSGLAISLTFGGRPDVGDGFAIPLVVRYVLETCDDVAAAREALARIPVHAPQNLTLLDRSGAYLTAYVGPGREPRFVDVAATTNHQGEVEWPEYAEAIRSEEREQCVLELLSADRERFEDAFLEPPLHSTAHERGFGTIYTAAYEPAAGVVRYRWPDIVWEQSFDRFEPGKREVRLS
jgi:predicted choloylglycine hydrolase